MRIEWEEFKDEDNRVMAAQGVSGWWKAWACFTQPFRFIWFATILSWQVQRICKQQGCRWAVDSCLGVDRRYCARCGGGFYE